MDAYLALVLGAMLLVLVVSMLRTVRGLASLLLLPEEELLLRVGTALGCDPDSTEVERVLNERARMLSHEIVWYAAAAVLVISGPLVFAPGSALDYGLVMAVLGSAVAVMLVLRHSLGKHVWSRVLLRHMSARH